MDQKTAEWFVTFVMFFVVMIFVVTIAGVMWRWVWQPLFTGGC